MSSAWRSAIFKAWDIRAALVTFGLVMWLGETHWQVRDDPHLLDVSVGLSVAVLAVVLAALSILVAFLSEDYAQLLAATKAGVAGATRPYVETAIVSCATAVVSLFGQFIWPIAPPWGRTVLLASALGLAVWTTVGTVELVAITAKHGRLRARLPEIETAYREAKKERAKAS